MVYAVEIKNKQTELSTTQELAKEATQSFLNLVLGPTPITFLDFGITPKPCEPYSWPVTLSGLQMLGKRRLSICLEESAANYDLLASLLDRVRFFILHRKDLFQETDPELVRQSAFSFFDVALASKNKASELYISASNFIEDDDAKELKDLKKKEVPLREDFEHATRDIKHARIYRKFISDNNPNYHERYWTYPEDVPTAYGDHLFELGNRFSAAALLEAQRVENIVDYLELIDKSTCPDKAWKETFSRMRGNFIREGRPSAETVPKLLTMAGDAYTTALKFTSY